MQLHIIIDKLCRHSALIYRGKNYFRFIRLIYLLFHKYIYHLYFIVLDVRNVIFQMTQTKTEHLDATTVVEEQATDQPKSTPSTATTVQASASASADPPLSNIPSDSSSVRSRRSLSIRKSDGDKNAGASSDQQQFHGAAHQHHHCHHYHHYLHPQISDVSWDEDTSSTSGYRESYSMQLVSLDGAGARSVQAPPLASPDLNDMPSTSSTTTNYIGFDGSSPDCSINGSGGEKTALLTSSQRTTSQHSLLMVFPNQDEDTLI